MAKAKKITSTGLRIPPISEKRLQALAAHIRPVVRMANGRWKQYKTHGTVVRQWFEPSPSGKLLPHLEGEPYFVEMADLRQNDPRTDPKPLEKAGNMERVHRMGVFYPAEAAGPSAAHVLAQIPRDLVNDVRAYEVVLTSGEISFVERKMAIVALYA